MIFIAEAWSWQEWWVIVWANLTIMSALHIFLLLRLIKSILPAVRTQSRSPQSQRAQSQNQKGSEASRLFSKSSQPPKATIILCLRGADPFLADCLQGLLNQDYPNYTIQIVIDSEHDPAWQVVNQAMQNHATPSKIRTALLTDHYDTCGLKCSALIQAVSQLDEDCEIIALADADMIASASWLRTLIEPLSDPQVGLTTGNRWYAPSGDRLGSIVRYLWNAFAVVIMYSFQLPWGGTLALRVNTLHQLGVLKYWQKSLVDDASLHMLMQEHNLEIRFVPALVAINREECQLSNFLPWAARQSLYSRLYSPFWGALLLLAMYSAGTLFIAEVGLGYALLTAQAAPALLLGISLALYFAAVSLALLLEDRLIWKMSKVNPQAGSFLTFGNLLKSLLLIPSISYVYFITILTAQLAYRINWRGIEYQIDGPDRIQVLNYQPYSPTGSTSPTQPSDAASKSEYSVSSLN